MTSSDLEFQDVMGNVIVPGIDRKLSNRTGSMQVIRNSLTMAYRGLLKIRHTPEQLFDVVFQPIIFTLIGYSPQARWA